MIFLARDMGNPAFLDSLLMHVEAGRKRPLFDAAVATSDTVDVLAFEELPLVAGTEVEAAPITTVAATQISNTTNATCRCRCVDVRL